MFKFDITNIIKKVGIKKFLDKKLLTILQYRHTKTNKNFFSFSEKQLFIRR